MRRISSDGSAPHEAASIARKLLQYGLIVLVTAAWLFPVYWLVVTSLKTSAQTLTRPPSFWFSPTVENYRVIFTESSVNLQEPLVNSLIIAGATTFISIVLGSICAYGLARLEFRGRDSIALWILSLRMMPAVAVVIPYYILFFRLDLIDTHLGMILVYLSFSLSFAVWLLRGFFADIPVEIDEAAELDGCGRIRTLFQVIFPVAKTGVAVTAIFVFVFAWNEFLFALSLTDFSAQTVPVAIAKLVTPGEVLWGQLTAASVISAIPLVVLVFILQRHIVRGLTLGAVKGR
jgi:multiple sugar transport system permease protein